MYSTNSNGQRLPSTNNRLGVRNFTVDSYSPESQKDDKILKNSLFKLKCTSYEYFVPRLSRVFSWSKGF